MSRYINEEKLEKACEVYEIDKTFANYFRILVDYKIVIIADDSGSMNSAVSKNETRWGELCKFIQIVFSITQCIENSLIDLFFLNRIGITNVQTLESISNAFSFPPKGPTPIVPILKYALKQDCQDYLGRIIIIATDGEPTDEKNRVNTQQLYEVLAKERRPNDYVTFLACTDDDQTMDYLNQWDRIIPRLDVIDDYASEKREIIRAQGPNFYFSYGDYVIKTMVGTLVPALDKLDEITPVQNKYRKEEDLCCEIL